MPTNEITLHNGAEVARIDKYDQAEMVKTLKETVCKGATDSQFRMFIEVCRSTGLNPFLREVWFVPSVGIMAGRDGYLRVANDHPQFDGMETRVTRDEKNVPIKAVCTVWRKDRNHPITCEAYYSEYKKSGNVWSQYPSAMISKVSEVLALKRSFAINGVVTEEEIGTGEPTQQRGSKEAAAAVAQAKIAGTMPLRTPEPSHEAMPGWERTMKPEPPPEPETPFDDMVPVESTLESVMATFSGKTEITKAFQELKKAWLQYESQEAWDATLQQFEIDGENYRSFGNAKRCFSALWKAVERMMADANEAQPA